MQIIILKDGSCLALILPLVLRAQSPLRAVGIPPGSAPIIDS